jgi:hypothetical protein
MSARARFKQSDVTRAVRGAIAAGLRVGKVEIDPSGKIIILPELMVKQRGNSWDDVLR